MKTFLELYDELKSLDENAKELIGTQYPDPFSENTENHSLIGVANVFLSVLFHDVNFKLQDKFTNRPPSRI